MSTSNADHSYRVTGIVVLWHLSFGICQTTKSLSCQVVVRLSTASVYTVQFRLQLVAGQQTVAVLEQQQHSVVVIVAAGAAVAAAVAGVVLLDDQPVVVVVIVVVVEVFGLFFVLPRRSEEPVFAAGRLVRG